MKFKVLVRQEIIHEVTIEGEEITDGSSAGSAVIKHMKGDKTALGKVLDSGIQAEGFHLTSINLIREVPK